MDSSVVNKYGYAAISLLKNPSSRYPVLRSVDLPVVAITEFSAPGGSDKYRYLQYLLSYVLLSQSPPPLITLFPQKSNPVVLKNGFSRVEYQNGDVYEGEFKDGFKHGPGTYELFIEEGYCG
jgi:hypothetical protein